jgi:hypothetical protein
MRRGATRRGNRTVAEVLQDVCDFEVKLVEHALLVVEHKPQAGQRPAKIANCLGKLLGERGDNGHGLLHLRGLAEEARVAPQEPVALQLVQQRDQLDKGAEDVVVDRGLEGRLEYRAAVGPDLGPADSVLLNDRRILDHVLCHKARDGGLVVVRQGLLVHGLQRDAHPHGIVAVDQVEENLPDAVATHSRRHATDNR